MLGTKTESRHRWQCGAVVRGGDARGRGRRFEFRWPRSGEFYAKNVGDGRALAGGGLHRLKKKSHFFRGFFGSMPSVGHSAKALPSARQKTLSKDAFADPFFAEWSLPSAALGKAFACRVQIGLCRVPLTLGKATKSGSESSPAGCLVMFRKEFALVIYRSTRAIFL